MISSFFRPETVSCQKSFTLPSDDAFLEDLAARWAARWSTNNAIVPVPATECRVSVPKTWARGCQWSTAPPARAQEANKTNAAPLHRDVARSRARLTMPMNVSTALPMSRKAKTPAPTIVAS